VLKTVPLLYPKALEISLIPRGFSDLGRRLRIAKHFSTAGTLLNLMPIAFLFSIENVYTPYKKDPLPLSIEKSRPFSIMRERKTG
jgi:hypothetical protein